MTNTGRLQIGIVGGGIVGAACAHWLAGRGARVTVFERGFPGGGATAEGMGHLALMDDNAAEFALCHRSQELWQELRLQLPSGIAFDPCGALWVAQSERQAAALEERAARFRDLGIAAALMTPEEIRVAEPAIREGWTAGLRLPADSVIYPPAFAAWCLSHPGIAVIHEAVSHLEGRRIGTQGREVGDYDAVVVASGAETAALVPSAPVIPRKGHLAITTRMARSLRSQVADVSYLDTAHTPGAEGISFNVQPRTTGQVLIGSSRQYVGFDRSIDRTLLRQMLDLAVQGMPSLAGAKLLRVWTGFRPATPDGLPLIGRAPDSDTVWLATGHEGLGITQSLATAELIADMVFGSEPRIDPNPFDPVRFAGVSSR